MIAATARTHHATYIDLRAFLAAAEATPGDITALLSDDGDHPSQAGHDAIANTCATRSQQTGAAGDREVDKLIPPPTGGGDTDRADDPHRFSPFPDVVCGSVSGREHCPRVRLGTLSRRRPP